MKIVVYTAIAVMIVFFERVGICQQEIPTGVRAIGMGETFVAIADDVTAIGWNPAGISQLRHYAFSSMHARLFDVTDINHLSLVIPISEGKVIGSDWRHHSLGDNEVGFIMEQFDLSYGHKIGAAISLGANLKYVNSRLSLDGKSFGNADGWGSDIGFIFTPPNMSQTSIGFSAQNLIGLKVASGFSKGTSLNFDNGKSDLLFPPVYKVGFARRFNPKWLLGVDLGRVGHVGVEFKPYPSLKLRGGIQKDLRNSEGLSYSAGGSIRYKWGEFNYAYLVPPSLSASSFFSLNFDIDLWSLPLEIESVKIQDLYPVHRHFYSKAHRVAKPIILPSSKGENPADFSLQSDDNIGRIWIKNLGDEPLDLKVKLYIDKYIAKGGTESIQRIHIEPRQRLSIPFERLALNEESLQLLHPKTVEAKVEIIDLSAESRRKTTTSTTITIQGRNNSKLDDIAKLASFITSTNRTVREFAQGVINQNDELIKNIKLNSNLLKAVLIFNALYGISYMKDPNLPFESGKLDEVKFPSEILRDISQYNSATEFGRTAASEPLGDCDDTTALFCSLLESIGIKTALIRKSEHVLMAFELGGISLEYLEKIENERKLSEPNPIGFSEFYIGIEGDAWIPVETTLIKDGFLKAWLKGVEETKSDVKDSIATQDAWEIYGSVNIMESWKAEPPKNDEIYRKTMDNLNSPLLRTIIEKYGGLIR